MDHKKTHSSTRPLKETDQSKLLRHVIADDRLWFSNNPNLDFRIRDYAVGEFDSEVSGVADDKHLGFVVVVRCGQNVRIREAVYLPKALMPYIIGVVRKVDGVVLRLENTIPDDLFLEHKEHFEAHRNVLISRTVQQEAEASSLVH
jgi:hypothetical protein